MADLSPLVTPCFVQLDAFLAGFDFQRSGDKELKRFALILKKCRVPVGADPQTVPVAEQRAAIRAVCIAIPLQLLRQLPPTLLQAIDDILAAELASTPLVDAQHLPCAAPGVAVWQGDMSRLRCDAVVNPANGALLGCFLPPHRCLDNILHAGAGPRLRLACGKLLDDHQMSVDGNGMCRVTPGFQLPATHVFHTVGPNLIEHPRLPPRLPTPEDAAELASCYRECFQTAVRMGLHSLAFCCISTGVFGYPARDAAKLALQTVRGELSRLEPGVQPPLVVFNVFKDEDLAIYNEEVPAVFAS